MRGKTDDTCVLIRVRVTRVTCVCSLSCTVYYTCREHREMGNTRTGETHERREGGSTYGEDTGSMGKKGNRSNRFTKNTAGTRGKGVRE